MTKPEIKKYKITPLVRCVKDEKSVKFHVKSNDYFGTIAAVLSLIKEDIKKGGGPNAARLEKTLKNLEKDLMFLQKNYRIDQIRPRMKNINIKPKGRPTSQ